MKTTWRLLFALACTLAGCSDEPRYHARTLSKWLIVRQKAESGSPSEQRAETAIRAIGTNALPYLTSWIAGHDAAKCFDGLQGFAILGPAAAPAVPQLAALLGGKDQLTGTLAGQALGHIGAPALPAVLNALTNKSDRIFENAAGALPDLGTNARPVIPILLRDLDNINPKYRTRSARALASLQIDDETLLPVFLKLLRDPHPVVRSCAVSGLKQFGPKARPAAATLLAMMENQDDRMMARDALIKIAPDMLDPRRK